MIKFIKRPIEEMGFNFIDKQYIPEGKDEFYLRKPFENKVYRDLTLDEILILDQNANVADNWDNVKVCDGFNPKQVKRTRFKGLVRIGKLENYFLEYHDLKQPVGIYDSTIVSCDLGDNVAINYVSYMAHYQVDDEVILFNISELIATSVAKFGNGILKEGENPDSRILLELGNENGGRSVIPFDGMLPADIYLWYKYRDDKELQAKFAHFTESAFDKRRGFYGYIGKQTIIKNCLLIKDCKIGEAAYIKGANKLKNLTVNSTSDARTQIGEGVELVNGIIGLGCRIFYGVKAVRFVMGQASQLKYGARLINSYLGDNSTISCCEVLNSLIYPFHEQHHNNSFLCASTLFGQTNLAAGATIGSNHNSRAADGEILAGRGFWPGLSVSLKHNSRFASYILISKGDFPAELDIKIPFALVNNNISDNCLEIMPAYWFMYNMYAIARNSWKYSQRDNRVDKKLSIEQDFLAPDTVNEIFSALELMEIAVGKSYVKLKHSDQEDFQAIGKKLLNSNPKLVDQLEILIDGAENSKRNAKLLKVSSAYFMFKKMVVWYGLKNLIKYCQETDSDAFESIKLKFSVCNRLQFLNLGGQLVATEDVENLKKEVKEGQISNWQDLHTRYSELSLKYQEDKKCHAVISMLEICDFTAATLTEREFQELIEIGIETQEHIRKNTYDSRSKDYSNSFRTMMYDNTEEMDEVVGKLEENSFIKKIQSDSANFILSLEQAAQKLNYI